MELVYLDLLTVHIASGRMNCTGLFLEHPYRMTQFWHFARSMGLFSFIICHCREITSGDFELGILDPSSIPGCPVGSVMGTHRDLGEDLKLPAVETAQCLYLQAYRKKGEEM